MQSSDTSLYDWGPAFRNDVIVATSRTDKSIPFSRIFRPLRIRPPQRHKGSGTDHRLCGATFHKNRHLNCTAANAQQLFSPASACYCFNSTTTTILSTSPNPQIHQDLVLSQVDDASDPQHFSTKVFQAPPDVTELSCSQKTHVGSNSRKLFVKIPFVMCSTHP